MAQSWWYPYPWWGGPAVDPGPEDWGASGGGAFGGRPWPTPADPPPWPWLSRPIPRPIPRPWPPWVDPAPDGGFTANPLARWRVPWPTPGDPAAWAHLEPWRPDGGFTAGPLARWRVPWPTPGDPAAWAHLESWPWASDPRAALRLRPNVDPPPDDIRARIEVFARWARDILIAAGHAPEALDKATVRDLVDAYAAASTPATTRSTASAVTAAQVAEMDKESLERLGHHLSSEKTRLDELSKLVQTRLSSGSAK